MAKRKKNAVELVAPGDPIAAEIALEKLAEMVSRRLQHQNGSKHHAEMTEEELTDTLLLQPWFLPREISNAIIRLLPVSHQDKWVSTFQDWGCWKCERREVIHQSLGLCLKCYGLVSNRLKSSIVRRYVGGRASPTDLAATHIRKAENARQIFARHDVLPPDAGKTRRSR